MVRMTRASKSKSRAAAWKADFKKRLGQLWELGASDAIEVIRSVGIVFYLWPARKKTLLFISTSRTPARDR